MKQADETARVVNQLLDMLFNMHCLASKRGLKKNKVVKSLIYDYRYVLHGRTLTNPSAIKYRKGAIRNVRRCLSVLAPHVGENVAQHYAETINAIDSSFRLLQTKKGERHAVS